MRTTFRFRKRFFSMCNTFTNNSSILLSLFHKSHLQSLHIGVHSSPIPLQLPAAPLFPDQFHFHSQKLYVLHNRYYCTSSHKQAQAPNDLFFIIQKCKILCMIIAIMSKHILPFFLHNFRLLMLPEKRFLPLMSVSLCYGQRLGCNFTYNSP